MTTTEPDMDMTERAKAIADAQPVIDVEETPPSSTAITRHVPPVPAMADGPGLIPHTDELQVLAQLAVTFAQAGLVPSQLRGKPADVLLVLMTGRGLGIDPLVALRECHPIDGKVTVSPKLKLAIVRQRGLGQVWPDPGNDAVQATWHATRTDDPRATVYSASYSIDDARTAGLAGKDNWKKYPRQMLQWRALGYLLDVAFGEVGTGLYSADELGAVTDDEGHAVIDVTEVSPLAGIEPPNHAKAKAEREAAEAGNAVAPPDVLDGLRERIRALLPPAVAALAEAWSEMTGEPTADGEATPRLWPLKILPVRQVQAAHDLVDEFYARAETGEFGVWVGHEPDVTGSAPTVPQDAPDADPGPDATQDPGTVTDDEGCTGPGCGDLAVILDDDANPWCQRHAPAELFPTEDIS